MINTQPPDPAAPHQTPRGIPVIDALQVLINLRRDDQMVVTNQGSSRIWPKLSEHPLDLHYNPSAMGGAIPLGLGLALAQPQREVLVVSGDGSLLMNLGSLVTVIGTGVTNLSIVLLDNGIYEITGGQKTAAANADVDYAGLARAAGFPNVTQFWDLTDWQHRAAIILSQRGPRFIWLQVAPAPPADLRHPSPPMPQQLERLQSALQL